jgi:hypothetical protein
VNSSILRHPDEIMQTTSVPEKQQRLQIPRMFPERTVHDLKEHIQGCVVEPVFNLDEVGISDWQDRETRKVLAPATMRRQTIYHRISRTVKHISVIACVSVAVASLTPYMITSQDSALVREQLKKQGVRFGPNFVLKSKSEPDINAEIVLDYIRTVLLSNPAELRTLDEWAEDIGVLFMANFPSHVFDDVIYLLTKHRARVKAFATHTTQISQVLDLTLFGVLKRRSRYELPLEREKDLDTFIMKVYHNFKQITVESNI